MIYGKRLVSIRDRTIGQRRGGYMAKMSPQTRAGSSYVPGDVEVFDVEIAQCAAFLRRATAWWPSPYANFGGLVAAAEHAQSTLPQQLLDAVCGFGRRRYAGALLIRNLPLPPLPATPVEAFGLSKREAVGTELLLVAIGRLLGMPFSFVEWESQLIVHNKFPIREHAGFQFGSGSVEFLLHTETPFRDFSPDYVALFCLRSDPDGAAVTGLCNLGKVMALQSAASEPLFHTASFAFLTDNPVVTVGDRGMTEPKPLVIERDGVVQYEYVDDLVGTSEEAENALQRLRHDIHRHRCDVNLQAGDLLIIDNSHMIHGRTAYNPRYDGRDRWLQRLLISKRLEPLRLAASHYLIHDRCIGGYPTFYRQLLDSLNPSH